MEEYIYEVYYSNNRMATYTKFCEAVGHWRSIRGIAFISITPTLADKKYTLHNEEDIAEWQLILDRKVWSDKEDKMSNALTGGIKRDKIDGVSYEPASINKEFANNYDGKGNANHYQDIIPGYQYVDLMHFLLKDKDQMEASLLSHVYKYLMRAGKKDKVAQEYKKAAWYMQYLLAYVTAERPIKVSEVNEILGITNNETLVKENENLEKANKVLKDRVQQLIKSLEKYEQPTD